MGGVCLLHAEQGWALRAQMGESLGLGVGTSEVTQPSPPLGLHTGFPHDPALVGTCVTAMPDGCDLPQRQGHTLIPNLALILLRVWTLPAIISFNL